MIYLCMPTYGGVHPKAWERLSRSESRLPIVKRDNLYSSILGECFNIFWTNALNLQLDGIPITHWVMLHGDVVPEDENWLDILANDMDSTGADVVSAVIPIKDHRGLASMATDGNDRWNVRRQYKMEELLRASTPQLFSWFDPEENTGGYVRGIQPSIRLLVNTGCMMVDFTKAWRKFVSFGIETEICPTMEDGKVRYRCRTMTEDWRFSRAVYAKGGFCCATRHVRLKHYDHTGKGYANYVE